ncbi:5093_t:CDS:2, partial [Dentiscutata erythropus]
VYSFSKVILWYPTRLPSHQHIRAVSSERNGQDRLQKYDELKALFDKAHISAEEFKEARSNLLKYFTQKVPGLHPVILEYKDPLQLLSTHGANWDYQEAPELEKKNSLLLTIMGGAGIGKSRLLMKLPKIARSAVNNDELKKHLDNALVFNISFENGTSYDSVEDHDPLIAIGVRMLWQLQTDPNDDFSTFQRNPEHRLGPNDVLKRIARFRHQKASDLTVFLLLDSIHNLMENSDDGLNKNSRFYSCLSIMANNIITSKPFIIGCCSATSMKPMRDILAKSRQLHIQLLIPQLKAPSCFHRPVFDMEKPLVKILVEDMGGNSRALEALEQVIPLNIDDYCISDIIHNLIKELLDLYSGVLDRSDCYKEILQVILSNTPVNINFSIPGTDLRPDQFAEMGLVRFEAGNSAFDRLTCPYVWLWLIARLVDYPILLNWRFDDYNEIQHFHNPEKIPPGAQLWQNFERFVADFRVLKSEIYKYVKHSIHTIHPGGVFDLRNDNDIYLKSKPLKLVCSSNRVSTKSSSVASIMHESGTIDASDERHLILNGEGASAGQERNITEVLQIKKLDRKASISLSMYLEERDKAAGVNDIFLIVTTGRNHIDSSQLPVQPPDINTASRCWLSGIDGIGRKYADIIIRRRPYYSLEDCHQKTGISLKVLKQCNCIINRGNNYDGFAETIR